MIPAHHKAAGIKCLPHRGPQNIYKPHNINDISYGFRAQMCCKRWIYKKLQHSVQHESAAYGI